MAMDLAGGKGTLKADINVTPLVDVMLVLLIIMMLIAPMIHQDAIVLPQALNGAQKPDTPEQTVVAVDARGHFYVNALPVSAEDLAPLVRRALNDQPARLVYVKGDKDASYAAMMGAMDALRRGRIDNIALITEPKPTPPGPAVR